MKTLALPIGGGPDGQSPILVRKGEDVIYSLYSMHRRKDLFGTDAETFRPERWENKQLNSVENSFGYLPFHGDPRACPGRKLIIHPIGKKKSNNIYRGFCPGRSVVYRCKASTDILYHKMRQ